MIVIDNTIVSDEFRDARFCCNLGKCLGACCVEGDAGAPLEEEEISMLEDHLDDIKPFMTQAGIEEVERTGVFDYDATGNFVTPLVRDRDCAFVYYEGDIIRCAIQKAFDEDKIRFRKPVSCHLYPVRLSNKNGFITIKYHQWGICDPARKNGKTQGIFLYQFLEEALIRRFGISWYNQLVKQIKVKK
jgi:hypothetical protein